MTTLFGSARWIASSIGGGPRTTTPAAPYFRREFRVEQPVKLAQLTITALGLYEAEINGKRVGDQIFTPGWTNYHKRVQYQVYDVGTLLKKGGNALGAVLGEGWYSGKMAWHNKRQMYGDRPKLLARLEIIFQDGSRLEVFTDSTWKTATGPILDNDFQNGESYDARLELGPWSQPGYDEASWSPVREVAALAIEFTLSDGPPVRRIEKLPAFPIKAPWPDYRLFDFRQNFSGRVRLKVRAPRGTTLTLRFAEILDDKGNVYIENLRSARATDYYTAKGDPSSETWEPLFTFHGFRYLEITGVQPGCEVEVVGVVLHSDMKRTGHFACSNPLINQLQHNILWGQKSNFIDVPTDCPQRDERLGWTGDAQIFARTAAFNLDVQSFFHKWMRDFRDSQGANGCIPPVIPEYEFGFPDGGPAWADATIICPWTIYLCYGDRKILEDHYESMERYFAFLTRERVKNGIRGHPEVDAWGGFGDWLALDGGGKTEGITSKDLIGTAFYAYDAELLAKISNILGKKKEARQYRTRREEIVAAFQRRFVTEDGLLVSGTQTSYILSLHFGLLSSKHRKVVAKALVKDIEGRGFHIATGFVGTPYILDALEETGHLDVAYRLLEQETFPSWLFPVKNGATTIWERWDGWTPEKGPGDKGMNSFNHYAYGAVGAWMVRTVAGLEIDPAEPGYRHIVFRPRPGGTITWAEAELETPQGKIRIHWDLTKAALKLDLTVPKRAHATLQPPPGYGAEQKISPGRHKLSLKKS